MPSGYLYIETSPSHPGLLRLRMTAGGQPTVPLAGSTPDPEVRYIARFSDVEAAWMHAHEPIRFHLLDPDTALYRVGVVEAVAAIEANDLRHDRVYLDPALAAAAAGELAARVQRQLWRRRLLDRLWQAAGYGFVLLLLFRLFGVF